MNSESRQNKGQSFEKSIFSWNANASAVLKLTKTGRFQVFGQYKGPEVGPQVQFRPMYSFNLSFQQELFQKKLIFSLKAENLFNTLQYRDIFDWSNYHAEYTRLRKSLFLLSISYNFNNYNTKGKKDIEVQRGGF